LLNNSGLIDAECSLMRTSLLILKQSNPSPFCSTNFPGDLH
jgi:hypothetical protein